MITEPNDTQVFGIIRFSFVAPLEAREWRHTFNNRKEQVEFLFSTERMEQRFFLFEELTLPSLAAQSDQDFVALIVTSTLMPRQFRDRLDTLTQPYRNFRVIYLSPQPLEPAILTELQNASQPGKTRSAVFRLDDDDALSRNYIANLKEDSTKFAGDDTTFAITYPHGITASAKEEIAHFSETLHAYLALGLAVVSRGEPQKTPLGFAHLRIAGRIPTLSFAHKHMFIRTLHVQNDSRSRNVGEIGEYGPRRLKGTLETHYPFLTPKRLSEIMIASSGA